MNPLEYIMSVVFRLSRRIHLNRLFWKGLSTKRFTDYFKGFEKVDSVKRLFGDRTEEVLGNLKVEFTWFGYMGVDNTDGHLMVNERYLSRGDKTEIYLDVVHELCHVKQWIEGKELFDPEYEYVDRPTEVDAYRYTVQEAKRLGLSDKQILQYLKTEWMSEQDLKRLARNIGFEFSLDSS